MHRARTDMRLTSGEGSGDENDESRCLCGYGQECRL